MPVQNDALLSPSNIEKMPACDERLELALKFLKAAGECVNTCGPARTSTSRSDLLRTYDAMVNHGDNCDKCNEV
ncbi:hypothetical protein HDF11_004795 [Tunturiibacter psychrotolerans]